MIKKPKMTMEKTIKVTARPEGIFFLSSHSIAGPQIAVIKRAMSKGLIMDSAYLTPVRMITMAAKETITLLEEVVTGILFHIIYRVSINDYSVE